MSLSPKASANMRAAVTKILQRASEVRTVGDLNSLLMESLGAGDQFVFYVTVAAGVVGVIMLAVIVRGFFWLLRDDVSAKYGKDRSQKSGKAKKADSGRKGSDVESPSDAPAEETKVDTPTAKQPEVETVSRASLRTRPANQIQPSSLIKGFSRVGALAVSPCQRYLVMSCRKNKKARVYPQSDKRAFMDRGTELKDKHFVSLGDALGSASPDVSNVAFTSDGTSFSVGDSLTDSFVVFQAPRKIDPTTTFSKIWAYRLPNHNVVSVVKEMNLMHNGQVLAFPEARETGVEMVVHDNSKFGGSKVGKGPERLKIGRKVSTAMNENYFVGVGSMFKEIRIAHISPRHDFSSFQLGKTEYGAIHVEAPVVKMALTTAGAPEFSTAEWLVTFDAVGRGCVYNVERSKAFVESAKLIGTFEDPSFADGNLDGIKLAIRGEAYHERLVVALWHQGDISVHAQESNFAGQGKEKAPTMMRHVLDISDAHGSSSVSKLTFVQNGQGLATAGADDDGTHVRLWAIPASA